MKEFIKGALEFWGAEGIDMPEIDLFDRGAKLIDDDFRQGMNYKPVGMKPGVFERREELVKAMEAGNSVLVLTPDEKRVLLEILRGLQSLERLE